MTMTKQMKEVAWKSNSKLQPGKAYKIRKPAQPSSASSKMKHMAASCQACAGK